MKRGLLMRPVIMCKAPVPGKVKTRLTPALSPQQAAELYMAMAEIVIRRTLRLFPNAWIAADDENHPFFQSFGAPVLPQGAGNLGERMQRMVRRAVDCGADAVLLLGSDSPHMQDARLIAAHRALQTCDVVLGPVQDGGYDLLAVRGYRPELLHGVVWSTPDVLQQTLGNARQLGLSVRCLSTAYDLDTLDDVERARRAGLRI
ncbi:MAG: hypothetical protein COS82_04980 [Zetaproteobacteria bacterium CG06_land_8_20_14_3_00_59_53]|nr:MAG: hypothetical protein AUK36_04640 [Zetaproteobacteria bacterium CG2_30_59_37]PIO89300.1 MAG: hypothetical protein COX56_08105 [Zetaproteobacteria bacterium CG23_combo_of_CG06-09_8_20_14_all_59_86]PIQ65370.1 MAG: hypothetical protein COV97_04460 [Zetaproteobacteria bacterium CG11_big_fil_rev_8_21_14_0_20_59_439]PIU70600.1 MAG: hypothetical protein COS82_04980 [Zetaproteobacteria bacterium CG06_land_8_20_14_3_00_59_53]PIU98132.1 MAG: hypothetical protein COS62_00590 [Zetaproteobacteria bac